jgi:methylmalonyl-CoA/ethylmalonyl-CoA epimerase
MAQSERMLKTRTWAVSFDHAAIATREPDKLKRVLAIIGLVDEGAEDVASQGVKTHFLNPKKSETRVEILEVIDPQGTVAKYLDKKGPGIHHISFMVTNLDALCAELKAQNVRLVYDNPRTGAHHTRVNFIHPESTGGILLEVSEKA